MKSLITFARTQIGIRGKSENTGRGAVWMYGDGSYEEVVDILKSKMSRWESFIKEVKETEKDGVKRFSIRFDHEVFGDFNQLYLCNKAAGMMCGVAFTMDNMG